MIAGLNDFDCAAALETFQMYSLSHDTAFVESDENAKTARPPHP